MALAGVGLALSFFMRFFDFAVGLVNDYFSINIC